jgi:hypothetical protein
MWCWRRLEKTSWTGCVKNEEVLFRVNEQRNILQTIKHVIAGRSDGNTREKTSASTGYCN